MIGLFAAVECGDAKKVEELLPQDAAEDVSKMVDYRDRTALHFAVELGHEEVVDVLLGHEGIDLLAKDGAGFTALHLACELGLDKIVARLLAKNPKLADARAQKNDLSCLHLAAIRGKVGVVKLLLAMAPDLLNMEDKLKTPPLSFAVEYGREEIVEMFVESAKSHTSKGEVMFHAAIRSGHDKVVSQLLDHRPQLIDVVDSESKRSPLHLAAECGRGSTVDLLFARRQPRFAEVGGKYKGSLFNFAARYGCETIMAELLADQPHLTVDKVAGPVLHVAAKHGHGKIVEQLLTVTPLLIDFKDSDDGRSALHFATSGGHRKVIEQLLAFKPDLIDATDNEGDTALGLVCDNPQPELVACLLAHKPASVTGKMVWDALRVGRDSEDEVGEVLKLMIAHKPELAESLDSYGNTLLHRVFGYSSFETFYDLNDDDYELFGEDLMTTVWQLSPANTTHIINNSNQQTPLRVAIFSKNTFAIELVLWKYSLDEIVSAFAKKNWPQRRQLLDRICEVLLESLDRDVVGTVWDYLGLERPSIMKRRRERKGAANSATMHVSA